MRRRAISVCGLACLLLTFGAAAAQTTYVVDTPLDDVDIVPGDGLCLTPNGNCSLRAAFMEANANSGIVNIVCNVAQPIVLTIGGSDDTCLAGDLDVNPTAPLSDLRLFGAGVQATIIETSFPAGSTERILDITGGATNVAVTVQGLTMRLGQDSSGAGGGAILHNGGSLSLIDVDLSDNSTTNHGGAVRANRPVSIDNCGFVSNSASGDGGGLYVASGLIVPISSFTRFESNLANRGGGLMVASGAAVSMVGGDFAFNDATQGGGLRSLGTIDVFDVLFYRNRALGGGNGGAIAVQSPGTVNVWRCILESNTAENGGGAINNQFSGVLRVTDSAFLLNAATNLGGAISNAGDATVDRCEFTSNRSDGTVANAAGGGAVYNQNAAGIFLAVNSTFSGNTAVFGYGGGICNDFAATVELSACTLLHHGAQTGNSLFNGNTLGTTSIMRIIGSVIDDTAAPPGAFDNIVAASPITSFGYNINGDGTGMLPVAGDQFGTPAMPLDPMLGPLQLNGGPTRTHEPLAGSPAIDRGICSDAAGNVITVDQRGFVRPEDGDGNGSFDCDVGAVEAPTITIPLCGTCPGDMDGDNDVDGGDAQGFIACWFGGTPAAPGCGCSDMNGNGVFDPGNVDLTLFADKVLGISDPIPACP